jgi:DNA mismatch repair protein MutS
VIVRAREVLEEHENAELKLSEQLAHDEAQPTRPAQLTIFTPLSHQVVDRLREVDLNQLNPLQALNLLSELKKQLD